MSLGGRVLVGLTFTIDPFLTSIFSCSNLEPNIEATTIGKSKQQQGTINDWVFFIFQNRKLVFTRRMLLVQDTILKMLGCVITSDSPDRDMLSPVPPGDWYIPRSTKVVKEDFPDALTKPLD